jgi:hypothetical protein
MDTGRLAQAVSRPGIDPRTWVSLAVALGESHVDPAYGVFVNVQLMPTGEKYTAIVAADYVGPSFGFYTPIHLHDDLIVVIPGGDPRLGVTVVKRLWTAADLPPAEAVLDPTEVMLVVEPDKNLRLKVTGAGKVEIDSDATVTLKAPAVRLGEEAATEQLVLGTTYRGNEDTMITALNTLVAALNTFAGAITTAIVADLAASAPPVAYVVPNTLLPICTALATAGATFQTAIGTFQGAAATYLSTVSNTK